MAESSWPTVAGARVVTDDQWELMAQGMSADGIFGSSTAAAPVFGDSTGRQVKVRAGRVGFCGGRGYSSGASDTIKTVGANSSGSTRIDLAVMGLDRTTWAVTTYIKAGTAGSGVPPALQRDARGGSTGKWEVPLATINVINGASTISASDVTNIAWFAYGDTVATVSTSPLLPPAADYQRLRYTDTNVELVSVSGAWRRADWASPWGIIGGRTYAGSTNLGTIVAGTGYSGMSTGSVALLAGRRYSLEATFDLEYSATSDVTAYTYWEVRKGSVTVVGNHSNPVWNVYQAWRHAIVINYEPGSNETVDFQLWGAIAKVSGTTLNWGGLERSESTSFVVRDIGPTGVLTAT